MSLDLDKSTWTRVAFGDVVRNVNNTTKDPSASGVERVIAMEHMDPGELQINRWGDVADGTTFTRLVTPGQTLFGKRRAYQRKVAFAEFEAVCSGDIYTFEAIKDALLPELLPFLVQSEGFFEHALGTSAGSLSPRTNWRDLSNFEFNLPPLDEQQRIAELMWAGERHLQSESLVQNELLISMRKFRDESVGELLNQSSRDFSEFWEKSPESGFSAPPVCEQTGHYVLSLAAIDIDGYRSNQFKQVKPTDSVTDKILKPGDLLISRANTRETVGRAAIFPENRSDVSFPDTMMRLHMKSEVSPAFTQAVIASMHGRKHMRRTAAGSATSMVKINRQSLGKMPFPVATLAEQQSVVSNLHIMESAVAANSTSLHALTALRATILNEIFRGD